MHRLRCSSSTGLFLRLTASAKTIVLCPNVEPPSYAFASCSDQPQQQYMTRSSGGMRGLLPTYIRFRGKRVRQRCVTFNKERNDARVSSGSLVRHAKCELFRRPNGSCHLIQKGPKQRLHDLSREREHQNIPVTQQRRAPLPGNCESCCRREASTCWWLALKVIIGNDVLPDFADKPLQKHADRPCGALLLL